MLHILSDLDHMIKTTEHIIMERTKNGCRKKTFFTDSIKLYTTHSKPVPGIITLILPGLLPALLFNGCMTDEMESPHDPTLQTTEIEVKSTSSESIGHTDIFTFDDDILMRLDSYQRVDEINGDHIEVRSQNGNKLIFVCSNICKDKYDWAEINSFQSISQIQAELSEERRRQPVMTGAGKAVAGSATPCVITLKPIVSEIYLRSLKCDFSGTSYEDEVIRNPAVYLTNVNARCGITAEGEIRPSHIINAGGLVQTDISCFSEPDIIYRKLGSPIGRTSDNAGISLLCYPNTSSEEGPGTPFTRLVIEGEIEGSTYWWPIDINRNESTATPGIRRNCSYVYDIIIKRKGSDGPESPIDIKRIDVEMEVLSWKEKEEYSVGF